LALPARVQAPAPRRHAAPDRRAVPPAWTLHDGDALAAYESWPAPSTVVSDGAYGVGGFPGDPRTPEGLVEWYRPHVEAWSKKATPATTLWFWNTEVGWATVHPLLVQYGWEYVQTIIWDKGIEHIAGNVNGETIRRFPVVTEVCVLYRRRLEFPSPTGVMSAKEWLRSEWKRAGLALNEANDACNVKNAATRKYLTQDWLWYFPPPEMMALLVAYANKHGDRKGKPYFSIDGKRSVTPKEWAALRHPWTHEHAVTNVWTHPPLNGEERYKGNGHRAAPRVHNPGKNATAHLNQKPLAFMRRMVKATTRPGDVVWEPFGGLCSASVAAIELTRRPFGAERYGVFFDLAAQRLEQAANNLLLGKPGVD
jgi:DNA methylase